MFALGAVFFLLGLRFMLLRWREMDIGERRIRQAIHETERALRDGVNVMRSTDDFRAGVAQHEADESRVVQARSDPPGPLP